MDLIIYPNKILRTRCSSLKQIDDQCRAKARQMLELMYAAEGVGLAGPQVGWTARIVTLDATGERVGERIFVNPRIIAREGETVEPEGCLSLPGIYADVPRAAKVVVVGYTLVGERVELEAEGLEGRAWQHEIDHLNGILFVDLLPPAVLMKLRRELKQLARTRPQKTDTGGPGRFL